MSWSSGCSQDGSQEGFGGKMMVEDIACTKTWRGEQACCIPESTPPPNPHSHLPPRTSCNLVARKHQGRVMTPLLRAVRKGEPQRTVPCDSWQGHLFICMLQNDQSGKNMTDTTGLWETQAILEDPHGSWGPGMIRLRS